jgi:UDP-N-acetylglucosamine enolpyruvyl transferase
VVKDAVLYNESLEVSHAMKPCHGETYSPIILETDEDKTLKKIISENSQEFIDYLHKLGLDVEHKSKTMNLQNTSTTTLTLKTKCFKVDFNDNFAKIAPLK